MRAADAIRDISDAVQFIRERAGVERVALVGWSWGTVTAGMYTAAHNDMVHKLVLYAPVYAVDRPQLLRRFKLADPNDAGRFNPAIGAYRTITAAAARGRWEAQIVPEDKDLWREDRVFRTWFAEIQATDPLGAAANPAYVRAPNGVLVDVFEIFSNRPVYDAKAITVPTLIIRGADDPTATDDDARGLLARLGAADKSYRILPDGSHFISLEREGARIFDAVQEFLDR
jgi:pimeloyl-ACP methyl ester carboxylesterase